MDVKVKALKAHTNEFGKDVEKKEGDNYSLPEEDAGLLIRQKIVEAVGPAPKP